MGGSAKLYFRVGLMVLAGLAAIVAVTVWIGADRLRGGGEIFETYFSESVQGLDPGAAVRFRGVQLGRVSTITLAFNEYAKEMEGVRLDSPASRLVVVRFEINRSLIEQRSSTQQQVMVAAGLRVRMSSQGLTGVTYLEADFFDPARFPPLSVPWQPRYPVIPSAPSTLTQFQSQAEALLAELREADLAGAVADLRSVLIVLKEQFTSGEGYAALVAAADAMRSADATLRTTTPAAIAALDEVREAARGLRNLADGPLGGEATAAAASLRAGLARLPATLGAAESTLRRIDSIGADSSRELGPLLRDLRAAADNLRAVTEQMRQYPSQLLFGQPPPRTEDPR